MVLQQLAKRQRLKTQHAGCWIEARFTTFIEVAYGVRQSRKAMNGP